ncbi:MAG: MerC domain-containing protein [Phenylobacterium sp.]|uniref:MerC domain-containing protein n=1 Tax=Phenylobacterium sp. TaxID=1871053 RepID=UPI00391B315F
MSDSLRLLDRSAIGLSGLCLIHCLALPAAAVALPMLGSLASAEWVHVAFVALAAPLSAFALGRSGAWRSPLLAGLAAFGLGLLAAGAFVAPTHGLETAMTVVGGLCLALCHGLNLRRGRHHA